MIHKGSWEDKCTLREGFVEVVEKGSIFHKCEFVDEMWFWDSPLEINPMFDLSLGWQPSQLFAEDIFVPFQKLFYLGVCDGVEISDL